MLTASSCDRDGGREAIRPVFVSLLPQAALFVLGVFSVFLCLLIATLLSARRESELRGDLLRQADELARAMNPFRIRLLAFDESDRDSPMHFRISEQLRAYVQNSDLRGAYSLALRGGVLVFGPESYEKDDTQSSAPGTVYKAPPAALQTVFRLQKPMTAGPYVDEYGEFVSAFAPVLDPHTGNTLMVVGIDVVVDQWKQYHLFSASLFWRIAAALLLLTLVASMGALHWRSKQSPERQHRWRHIETAMIGLFSLMLTLMVFRVYYAAEQRERRAAFNLLAAAQAEEIGDTLVHLRRNIESVVAFFSASENVDPSEFKVFVDPLTSMMLGQSLAWAPCVLGSDRVEHESEMQSFGIEKYHIWSRTETGERESAPLHKRHFPIAYIAPAEVWAPLRGYDLLAFSPAASMMRHSANIGLPAAMSPSVVFQSEEASQETLVFAPIANEAIADGIACDNLAGFVVAYLHFPDLLDRALGAVVDHDETLSSVYLLDLSTGPDMHCVAYRSEDGEGPRLSLASYFLGRGASPRLIKPIFVFGRTYAVLVEPTQRFYTAYPLRGSWAVLIAGGALSLLFVLFVGLLRSMQDYLEQQVRRRTAETQESEARNQAILHAMPDLLFIFSRKGVFLGYHAATNAELAALPEQFMGKTVAEALSPELGLLTLSKLDALYATGEMQVYDYEVVIQGNVCIYESRLVRLDDDRALSIVRDITEHRRAEAERLQLEQQLQQTQKLESLGVLAGGIAHDFNNILMAVMGHAELALEDLPTHLPARENLQEIEKAAHRAAELCRQMLAYTGKATFSLECVNLADLIREMARFLETSISKKAVCSLHVEPGLPCVQADPSQMRQVFMNLIINASEALGERGGEINIALRTELLERPSAGDSGAASTSLAPGNYVVVEVKDNGCGMDAETRRRIFETIFSTKFTVRGLGLAAVLGIVQAHKGAVSVHSEPGQGALFRVLFPALARAATPSAPSTKEESTLAWRGHGSILLVDDEVGVRAAAAAILERMGFSVVQAKDGVEALELYRDKVDSIDLVLLDLTMPRMDGIETLAALRRISPTVRVVIASGYGQQEVAERFGNDGPLAVIQKPYHIGALRALLASVLTLTDALE